MISSAMSSAVPPVSVKSPFNVRRLTAWPLPSLGDRQRGIITHTSPCFSKHDTAPPTTPLILSLPNGVDSGDFWERELQQPLLSLVQERDAIPVYGHNKLALWQWRT